MLATPPRFTVLIPSYNHAAFLPAAIASLQAQTLGDWEAVVVNDGSPDDTAAVLEALVKQDGRVRGVHQANGGCGAALNTALHHARGEWITWLSSDDFFEPEKLAIHAAAITQAPHIRFFYSHFYDFIEDTGEKRASSLWHPIPQPWQQVSRFMVGNYVHGNSICIHRSCFDTVGDFDDRSWQGQDFDMWLRLSARFESQFIPERTCVTRWHKGQTTNDFPEAGFFDSARACMRFLDAHSLPDLFPLLDLHHPDHMGMVIREVLEIALNMGAMLYKCGPTPALLNRFGEWLSTACPAGARAAIVQMLEPLVREVAPQLPRSLARASARLLQAHKMPLPYEPYPMMQVLQEEVQRLGDSNPDRVESIHRYAERLEKLARSEPFDTSAIMAAARQVGSALSS